MVVPANAGTHYPCVCCIAAVSAKGNSTNPRSWPRVCCGVWVPAFAGTTSAAHTVTPPSTATSAPVMYELSSDSRNSTACATSSAVPVRRIGTLFKRLTR